MSWMSATSRGRHAPAAPDIERAPSGTSVVRAADPSRRSEHHVAAPIRGSEGADARPRAVFGEQEIPDRIQASPDQSAQADVNLRPAVYAPEVSGALDVRPLPRGHRD